jgi:deoxyribonuclease IV
MAEDQKTTRPAHLEYDADDEYRPEPPPEPEIPKWKDGSVRVGIHTSIAGDITGSLEIAHGLGANALQIFSSSPRMWVRSGESSRISAADAARFRERRRELELGPLVIHCNYLINLASPDRVLRARSVQAFHGEIVRALALGADFLVVHPGACMGGSASAGTAAVAEGIRQAARGLKLEGLRILIENTAGQGTCIGSRFSELREILEACADLPMGVCIDTAHLFAVGHDLRTVGGVEETLARIEGTVGLANVHVIHVNDSKTERGSRVDRHAHLGRGKIGLEAFGWLLNHPLLAGRTLILETPIDKPGDDRRNVATLWKLLGLPVPAGLGRKYWQKVRQFRKPKLAKRRPAANRPARTKARTKKSKPRSRKS